MNAQRILLLSLTFLPLAACNADVEPPTAAATTDVAGWYIQREGRHLFQACGEGAPKPIEASADLIGKARAFGLEDDLPVYVRLAVTPNRSSPASTGQVVRVEQFGSETPVMDCAMTGIVGPGPSGG